MGDGIEKQMSIILNANRPTVLIKRQRSSDLIKIYEEKRKETSDNSQAMKNNSLFQILSPKSRFPEDQRFFSLWTKSTM